MSGLKIRFIVFTVLLSLPSLMHAQSIIVRKENARIEGQNAPGYQVAFQASASDVKSSLSKYLKELGKVRSSGEYLTVAEPLIDGAQRNTTLYATTKQLAGTTAAWIGAFPNSDGEANPDAELEKLAYEFGVAFEKELIQRQIDESLQALQAVERQQTRLSNQNKDLHNKIERNKREKIQLEKSLEENKKAFEQLTLDIAANARAQDSIAIATEQIRKVVELHQERQRQVK